MSWLLKYRKRRVDSEDECVRRSSMASSKGSLTQSQIEFSIFNMNPPRNRCERFLRSRPITDTGKAKQLLKMISIIMIPVVVLSGITASTFIVTLKNYAKSSAIRDTLLYSVKLGQVIHYVQEERDMSALYLSSIQKETKNLLLQRYVKTDSSLENFRFSTSGPMLIRNEFQSKEKFLGYLNKHRYEMDIRAQTVDMELQFYTALIRVFIVWLYDAVIEDQSGSIWRSLVAYQEIVLAKEYMGLERALGTVFYADGRFPSLDVYLWFSESQDVTNATFLSAKRYSDLVHDLYEKNVYGKEILLGNLGIMRAEIRRNDLGGNGSIDMAQWWFENMTLYMNLLLVIQRELATEITEMLDERQDNNMEKMYVISFLCICVVFVSVMTIYVVYTLTNTNQKYSISLAQRVNAFNKEKKRSDTLLYQMLPKPIADVMKGNEEVVGRNYPNVTIFYSDILEFTQITARSSPIQVIQMMNKMYGCIDDVMNQFDVYKIETIGDANIISSGVPIVNGEDHVVEICHMGLKIIQEMRKVEIPHLPGEKFQLRIGCHSGSVVAAVVGLKMPKYCLLGETVRIANKMKSLGKPGKIHISEMLYDSLPQTEELRVVERFDESVKEELNSVQGINGRTRTFWLLPVQEAVLTPASSLGESFASDNGDECPYGNGSYTNLHGKMAAIV